MPLTHFLSICLKECDARYRANDEDQDHHRKNEVKFGARSHGHTYIVYGPAAAPSSRR